MQQSKAESKAYLDKLFSLHYNCYVVYVLSDAAKHPKQAASAEYKHKTAPI